VKFLFYLGVKLADFFEKLLVLFVRILVFEESYQFVESFVFFSVFHFQVVNHLFLLVVVQVANWLVD